MVCIQVQSTCTMLFATGAPVTPALEASGVHVRHAAAGSGAVRGPLLHGHGHTGPGRAPMITWRLVVTSGSSPTWYQPKMFAKPEPSPMSVKVETCRPAVAAGIE